VTSKSSGDRDSLLSSKRNVELNKILHRTIWNIYGIVFKRLKINAPFIRCRIKRLLDVLLYNTGYIWTRTQLDGSSNMIFQAVYSSKYITVLTIVQ